MEITHKKGSVACVYERERCHLSNRDRMIFYRDGRIKFETYCYGEAATLTFECFSAEPMSSDGKLYWPKDIKPPRDIKPPAYIRELSVEQLTVENFQFIWNRIEERSTDSANGYGFLRSLILKAKG